VALGVVILVSLGNQLRVSYQTSLTGCARDHGTGGAAGLYRWATRIGIPVRLLEVPVWEASHSLGESTGNCLLTMGNGSWSSTGDELKPASWQSVRNWLARGNTLIVVTSALGSLPVELQQGLFPSTLTESGTEPASKFGHASVGSRPETTEARLKNGEKLTVELNGPRGSFASTRAAAPGASGTSPSKSPRVNDPEPTQLAGDLRGGVLFRIPVGQGSVYLLLDEFAWTNAGLDQGDNARVLAEVLDREISGGGVLEFDEYRHGHGRTESFLTFLLNLPGSSAFLQLAAIWAILYVYARNIRLKPTESYVERERRTAQEYIDAVAQLYERARAVPLVVEAVARRLRQLSRSSAETPASVERLLQRAEETIKGGERPSSPVAATQLVNSMIQLRKKIYGNRTVS
jgi:hypothetical protein